ncbi:hypothetical protein QQF64_026099 [Cirrhinus molitorella]|uniref:Peptidase S1 domain-containing protein n=1 Tax=Cirrhinus molitorella TaxID=172907 RepID=A0ABR3NS51_9TELE
MICMSAVFSVRGRGGVAIGRFGRFPGRPLEFSGCSAGALCQIDVCGQVFLNDRIVGGEECDGRGLAMAGRLSQSGSNPNETSRRASQIINHPKYNSSTFDNDIALVKLSSSVAFSDFIRPVSLAAAGSEFAAGTESWVTGWGLLEPNVLCRRFDIYISDNTGRLGGPRHPGKAPYGFRSGILEFFLETCVTDLNIQRVYKSLSVPGLD